MKLRILDVNGKKSTVTRSMKNIQKMKRVEFKTLDSTIATKNDFTGAVSQLVLLTIFLMHQNNLTKGFGEYSSSMEKRIDFRN